MSAGWLSIVFLVALLALVPLGIKWLQRRLAASIAPGSVVSSKVVSAVAVGPHQQVVTVEVGFPESRVRLVLGVTAQSVTLLHQTALPLNTPDVVPAKYDGLAGHA